MTWAFWKRLFKLIDQPKKLWRFIVLSAIAFIALFIGCIFLPQFAPIGSNKGDLLEGMLLGFAAVAGVLCLARVVVRLFEGLDSTD